MQKSLIFKDNKDKSFVYRWINKVNNKEYLGSTANAKRRLLKYYDLSSLNLVNMPIYKAILKYGHSNFIFEIIEYCEPDVVLKREQYYLDNFYFSYNILYFILFFNYVRFSINENIIMPDNRSLIFCKL